MAKQYLYTNRRTMTPRPGTKFSTVYYDLPATEYAKLKRDVHEMVALLERLVSEHPELADEFLEPQKKHRRKDGTYYTAVDIMLDLKEQLDTGKDITDSMINRWNTVFGNSPDSIELIDIDDAKQAASTFTDLFGE